MHHAGTPAAPGGVDANGLAHITTAELDWLENEINTLPERWQSFVCSHFPVSENFGNNVKYTDANYNYSLTPFNDIMRDASTRVLAHHSGHRHSNWAVDTQDGVTHITSGGVSYGAANGSGSFTIMTYDPANRSITMDQRLATSPYARLSGMTPLVIQLQPHRLFFART